MSKALDKYLFYWDVKYHSIMKTDRDIYNESQKVFKEVKRIKKQFTMRDVFDYVDEQLVRRFNMLSQIDKFTMTIQSKTPEDSPLWSYQRKANN